MNNNDFDNTIEKKDIENISIENMEVSYDESSEVNPKLGAEVEMAMQETTIFSTEELSAVLDKSQEPEDLNATRVINIPVVDEMDGLETEEETQLTFDVFATEGVIEEQAPLEEIEEANEADLDDEDVEEYDETDDEDEIEDDEEIDEEETEYEEGEDEYEEPDEDEDEDEVVAEDDLDFDDVLPAPVKKASAKNSQNKKGLKGIIGKMGALEYACALVALVIIALVIVLGIKVVGNKQANKPEDNQIASIGAILENINGIGDDGIRALEEKVSVDSITKPEEIVDENLDPVDEEDEEEEDDTELAQVSVNFSSIEKDLKIKFTDKATGKLVTGAKFEVLATGPKNKSYDWIDSDMDGIIYVDKLDPGNYDVKIVSFDKYKFPDTTTRVKVQDTVVYQVINIMDETYNMKDVDLSKEEYTGKNEQEEVQKDTVEWVPSASVKSDKPVRFVAISKDKISTPVASNTNQLGGNMKVAGEEPQTPAVVSSISISGNNQLKVNETIQLSANVVMDPQDALVPLISWSSSDNAIATVDSTGLVTGVAAGTVDISAVCGDKSGVYTITVSEVKPEAPVKALKLTVKGADGNPVADTINIPFGSTYQLSAVVEGYLLDGGVIYYSSLPSAATISEQGLITPVARDSSTDITVETKELDSSGIPLRKIIRVNVINDPSVDNSTLLKTSDGSQVFIKDAAGNYVEARISDYYTASEFYIADYYILNGWQTIDGKVYYYDKNGNVVTGEQIIQGAKYNFASDGALIMDNGTMGIDVSVYQGSIDWNAVKNAGVSFVIIRCGFRGYGTGKLVKDSNFYSYIKGANDAGLKVGIYVFSQAINEAEAVEEASLCVNMVQGYRVSYPIYIDVEEVPKGGRANNLSKAERTAICKAFCETIKSAGYTPGVYANKDYLNNKLNAKELEGYKIWLAHYCTATDYKGKYDMWQRSKKGKVNGIKGDVDLDISYLGY